MKYNILHKIALCVITLHAYQINAVAQTPFELPTITAKAVTGIPNSKVKVERTFIKEFNRTQFTFTIPRGKRGPQGETGLTGPAGASGPLGATGPIGATGMPGVNAVVSPVVVELVKSEDSNNLSVVVANIVPGIDMVRHGSISGLKLIITDNIIAGRTTVVAAGVDGQFNNVNNVFDISPTATDGSEFIIYDDMDGAVSVILKIGNPAGQGAQPMTEVSLLRGELATSWEGNVKRQTQ